MVWFCHGPLSRQTGDGLLFGNLASTYAKLKVQKTIFFLQI